jgi:hypothetical protein
MCHHAQSLVKMGVLSVFCLGLASSHNFPHLHFLSSWDYRHEPLYLDFWWIFKNFFSNMETRVYYNTHIAWVMKGKGLILRYISYLNLHFNFFWCFETVFLCSSGCHLPWICNPLGSTS